MAKIIDIYSKGDYPSNVLSNFYPNSFEIDGIICASMEGFLQSLKYKCIRRQIKVCSLSGVNAKNKGKYKFLWKLTGNVYWQGRKIKRNSEEFARLILKAYSSLFLNETFYKALKATVGFTLVHSIGKNNERKTILTESEFINALDFLRQKIK